MINVVLVDDHPIVRHGMRRVLEAEPGVAVAGEAENGYDALALLERLQPDVAIIDLMLPDLNGLEVTRRLQRISPQTRVMILSMYSDEPHVLEAVRVGATVYIIKGASAQTLIHALREVMAGRRYLSPPLSDRAIEFYLSPPKDPAGVIDTYAALTDREREVLELLARGVSYAEMAEKLTISPRTAETHCTNIKRKLGLKTPADVTLYAIQRGLIAAE